MSKLQQQRIKAKLSQSELARLSGVSIRTLQAYEVKQHNIDGAKIKTLLKLTQALGCTLADILEDEELVKMLEESE